mmetsp:Transcript_20203/g.39964  ORF Transcript_20203/g.39964 Transcript_20203/m.39964 type:complete len:108 (-) Transcript_20203:769-1092(-)
MGTTHPLCRLVVVEVSDAVWDAMEISPAGRNAGVEWDLLPAVAVAVAPEEATTLLAAVAAAEALLMLLPKPPFNLRDDSFLGGGGGGNLMTARSDDFSLEDLEERCD